MGDGPGKSGARARANGGGPRGLRDRRDTSVRGRVRRAVAGLRARLNGGTFPRR